ncbi:pentapeptide repeat-containing protein [Crateriforma spongiae]|uniref:pentapeptide repeat-containing protein n=1 Tax=Crateriforma spongiae TaxID=2724528 RepID=UPI0039B04CDF
MQRSRACKVLRMDSLTSRPADRGRSPTEAMSTSIKMQNGADNMDVVAQDQTFADCIAEGSHFEGATLTRVTFTRCDLYWASFFMAQLTDVTFDRCDLRGSDFKEATLRDCRFLNCDVGTDAIGGQSEFGDTDLSTVQFVNCRGR